MGPVCNCIICSSFSNRCRSNCVLSVKQHHVKQHCRRPVQAWIMCNPLDLIRRYSLTFKQTTTFVRSLDRYQGNIDCTSHILNRYSSREPPAAGLPQLREPQYSIG